MRNSSFDISKGVDWGVVIVYTVLVITGIASIFATTYRNEDLVNGFLSFNTDYSRQLLYFFFCIILAVFILLTDSKFFTATANIFYIIGIILLLLVFPFHTDIKGTKSIIRLPGFQFQPAELCKLFVNLALAKYLSSLDMDFKKLRSQVLASLFILGPAVLAVLQSETGLALVYLSFFLVMYREGMSSTVLWIGFSLTFLVILTLLLDPDLLAIILTAMAGTLIFILRRQFRRNRSLLFFIIGF